MTYMIIEYKGYDVSGGARIDQESGQFFPTLSITKHMDSKNLSLDKIFPLPRVKENLFPDEDAAIQAALQFGYDVIDGKIEGATVDDMQP